MKKFLLGSLVLLITFGILSSRELMAAFVPSPSRAKGIKNTPSVMQAQATQTPAPTATATVDNIATLAVMGTQLTSAEEIARQRQLEVDAMNRMMVEATITHEFVVLQQAQMTQASEIQMVQATQLSNIMTQTVAPTAIPLTMTAQVNKDDMQKAAMTQTAGEADRIKKKAAAEAYADNAGWLVFVEGFMKFAFGIMIAVLSFLLLIIAVVQVRKPSEPPAPVDLNKAEFVPIPMTPVKDNPNQTLRAEIHCTNEQMFTVADGIINSNMTLAFGQWEGSEDGKGEISKSVLNIIRQALSHHKIIKPLTGHEGEWDVKTVECEAFMRYVLEHGKPPTPFVCVG